MTIPQLVVGILICVTILGAVAIRSILRQD